MSSLPSASVGAFGLLCVLYQSSRARFVWKKWIPSPVYNFEAIQIKFKWKQLKSENQTKSIKSYCFIVVVVVFVNLYIYILWYEYYSLSFYFKFFLALLSFNLFLFWRFFLFYFFMEKIKNANETSLIKNKNTRYLHLTRRCTYVRYVCTMYVHYVGEALAQTRISDVEKIFVFAIYNLLTWCIKIL